MHKDINFDDLFNYFPKLKEIYETEVLPGKEKTRKRFWKDFWKEQKLAKSELFNGYNETVFRNQPLAKEIYSYNNFRSVVGSLPKEKGFNLDSNLEFGPNLLGQPPKSVEWEFGQSETQNITRLVNRHSSRVHSSEIEPFYKKLIVSAQEAENQKIRILLK